MANSSTPLLQREEQGTYKIPLIPTVIAVPLGGALSAVGTLALTGMAQVSERSQNATSSARPWMEFIDMSQLGMLSEGGLGAYFQRFRANFRYFFLNYIMVGMCLAVISVVTKPLSLIGLVILCWVYFQLFGSATEGTSDVRFLGMMLNERERTGLMLVITVIVFLTLMSSAIGILVTIMTGTLLVALLHGCLRKPHPSMMPTTSAV